MIYVCERFHVLPSQVMNEDAGFLQLLQIMEVLDEEQRRRRGDD